MNKWFSAFDDWFLEKCIQLYGFGYEMLVELEMNYLDELKKIKDRFVNE